MGALHNSRMIPVSAAAFLCLAMALALPLWAAEDSSSAARQLEEMVPMRDGVRLAATVFLPAGEGPWPVILSRTPYDRQRSGGERAKRYVENDFAYVIQDQRGRFESEGDYNPHENEIADGYDTVEWIAEQSWSAGKIANFQYLQQWGSEGARGNQKLMMGPFGHGRVRGDLEYAGTEGLRGRAEEEIRWFDYWLKGIDNGIMDEPAVTYYQMAAARKGAFSDKNGYRQAESWPPNGSRRVRFYLSGDGGVTRTPPTATDSSTTYRFDPTAEPVPTVGGLNLTLPLGPMEQREVGIRTDYLRFQTEPLAEDLTIAGKIDLELWAASTAIDTDFMVKLVDVYPDGYEALVLDTALRARYRKGRRGQDVVMLTPGEPTAMTIDMWQTALTFERGHRLAVHISSSNYPRFEINPNTGEAPGESEIAPRAADNTIYHQAEHPTAIVLPVLD